MFAKGLFLIAQQTIWFFLFNPAEEVAVHLFLGVEEDDVLVLVEVALVHLVVVVVEALLFVREVEEVFQILRVLLVGEVVFLVLEVEEVYLDRLVLLVEVVVFQLG